MVRPGIELGTSNFSVRLATDCATLHSFILHTRKFYVHMPPTRISGLNWVRCLVLLFYVHGKHLRSCRDGQLT